MKKLFITVFMSLNAIIVCAQANFEFKLITTVESVVPGGLGRSRMISSDVNKQTQESNLENFFSLIGINFNNIRNNDNVITDKITELGKEGWELYQVAPGVYSADKSTGIFVTRYFFRRMLK